MDLSDLDGLSDELKVEIMNRYDSSTKGLKDNAAKILDEKRKLQDIIGAKDNEDSAKVIADKLAAQQKLIDDEKEKNLKLAGDMEGLKAHYEEMAAKKDTETQSLLKQRNDYIVSGVTKDTKAEILQHVVEGEKRAIASQLLDSMIKGEFVDDTTKIGITLGKETLDSVDNFLGRAREDGAVWKHLLKADGGSGAGVPQGGNDSGGSGGSSPNVVDVMYPNN